MSNILLSIKNIYKKYASNGKEFFALNNVNLDIAKGEIIGLLGVNGAGKTTLSSILATLHPPTSGDVLYCGVSIYSDIMRYRRKMGFCPQKQNLDMQLNVRDNLVFAGRYFLLPESEIQSRVNEFMQLFGLTKYADFDIDQLSGGNKQKVLIARALMHKPDIVILDEPTVGLDPDVRRVLWEHIKTLKQLNIAVILTTHYLDEAEYLSDRLCILDTGRIRAMYTVKEMIDKYAARNLEEAFLRLVGEQEDV